MRPLVSILIPAFNAEPWIQAAIGSALAQTWGMKEILVLDDGSTDRTLPLAQRFASRGVKVSTQANAGAAAARNALLRLAQGDYVQWLDADDLLAPDKIARQLSESTGDRTLLSGAWGRFFVRPERARFDPSVLWQDLHPVDWLVAALGSGHMMHPAAWLVSRRLTDEAGPWDERLSLNDDGEYFCRVVAAAEAVHFVPEARAYYRTANFSSLTWRTGRAALESLFLSVNLSADRLLALRRDRTTLRAVAGLLLQFTHFADVEAPDLAARAHQRIAALGEPVEPLRETPRFRTARRLLGYRRARKLKAWLWRMELLARRTFDQMAALGPALRR